MTMSARNDLIVKAADRVVAAWKDLLVKGKNRALAGANAEVLVRLEFDRQYGLALNEAQSASIALVRAVDSEDN
jgi:hypothetical protein